MGRFPVGGAEEISGAGRFAAGAVFADTGKVVDVRCADPVSHVINAAKMH